MSISANEIKKVRSLSEKKFRDRLGLFCVEGEKMVEEALNSRFKVETVYRKDEIGEEPMSRISALASPSPALAVLHKPQDINLFSELALSDALGKSGLYLALDTIRDPGNLGTILRVSDWFGIDAVFAAPDTVDVFNPNADKDYLYWFMRTPQYQKKIVATASGSTVKLTSRPFAGRPYPPEETSMGHSLTALTCMPKISIRARIHLP